MERWPALDYADWKDTRHTLHMWTQVVGKTMLACKPPVNHWWHAGFGLTARGLETGPMYERGLAFCVRFDLLDSQLTCQTADGQSAVLPLQDGLSVRDFYIQYKQALHSLGLRPRIWPTPVEIPDPIPFAEDGRHAYDAEAARRWHRVLLSTSQVLGEFRARFYGKCSPVLFWWGTFDLAVTCFSGRPAPPRDGADSILREAMSHEEISHGWWPGDESAPQAMFYAYAAPEPAGVGAEPLLPGDAFYSDEQHEWFLPYDAVRSAAEPELVLQQFLHSTFDAGARLGSWDPALVRGQTV